MFKLLFFSLFICFSIPINAQIKFYRIPKQKVNLSALIGKNSEKDTVFSCFRISKQITLGEYRMYLNAIQNDSSEFFFKSQIPKIDRQELLTEAYLKSRNLDNEPVIGISFDNACNFALWYSKKQNKKGKYYRVPAIHEWLIMNQFLVKRNKWNEPFLFDWTMNAMDEMINYQDFENIYPFNYYYKHSENEPPVMKRKNIIGSSFRMKFQHPIYATSYGYYADKGYADIGFRLIELSPNDELRTYVKNPVQSDIYLR